MQINYIFKISCLPWGYPTNIQVAQKSNFYSCPYLPPKMPTYYKIGRHFTNSEFQLEQKFRKKNPECTPLEFQRKSHQQGFPEGDAYVRDSCKTDATELER